MKIAILTSGRLPVPATSGGAVETLIDMYLDHNEQHELHSITVYSTKPHGVPMPRQRHNRYVFVDTRSLAFRLEAKMWGMRHADGYYDRWSGLYLQKCLRLMRHDGPFDCVVLENRPGFALQLPNALSPHVIVHLGNDYLHPGVPQAVDVKSRCTGVIACSDYIRQRAEAVSVQGKDVPCLTVYNGIDVERFAQASPADRSSFGLQPDDFVVVYSGRLTPEKGVLELIQALARLTDIPRLRLLLIGASFYGTDDQSSPFIEQLRQAAAPLADRVLFTGFVAYDRMPSCLKLANVVVVPSMWEEPFGLTVVEAMAAGRPLVATRSGAIAEICEDVALLVDREQAVDGLARSIRHLYDHPDEAASLAAKAVRRSLQFGRDVFARSYLNALEKLCSQ